MFALLRCQIAKTDISLLSPDSRFNKHNFCPFMPRLNFLKQYFTVGENIHKKAKLWILLYPADKLSTDIKIYCMWSWNDTKMLLLYSFEKLKKYPINILFMLYSFSIIFCTADERLWAFNFNLNNAIWILNQSKWTILFSFCHLCWR